MKKQLPPGDWITFVGLTLQTTDEEFQTFLADCGLNVPVEHISISVGQSGRSAGAIISLSREDVCNLVHRALLDENGQTKTLLHATQAQHTSLHSSRRAQIADEIKLSLLVPVGFGETRMPDFFWRTDFVKTARAAI